jgi:hypothetical protein
MKIDMQWNTLVVEREESDPKFYGTVGAKGESRFLHALKLKLKALGYDLIKKNMVKDGHMVDEMQQYLRSRDINANGAFCVYSPFFAVEGANEAFNRGRVCLTVHHFETD